MVDETMANAARVHAVERGKAAADHTLIAFGGAAPLHAVAVRREALDFTQNADTEKCRRRLRHRVTAGADRL